jgi:hypothetical protein
MNTLPGLRSALFTLVTVVAVHATAASGFAGDALHRVQTYDGPALPRSEVAILFATDGRPKYESASICAVDGFSLERDGVCASVIQVLPGTHRLKLRYRSSSQFGAANLTVDVAANRLYQVNVTGFSNSHSAAVSLLPMPEGAKLSWRNVAPGLVAGHPRIDEEVPYETNSARGEPLAKVVLSDTDRATVDRLLSCAGAFSIDIELRKFDHQEYASGYATVGAFIGAAAAYVPEEDALDGRRTAARAAATTYRAAAVPLGASTEASTQARARLKSDLQACMTFYSTHETERVIQTQGRPK